MAVRAKVLFLETQLHNVLMRSAIFLIKLLGKFFTVACTYTAITYKHMYWYVFGVFLVSLLCAKTGLLKQ